MASACIAGSDERRPSALEDVVHRHVRVQVLLHHRSGNVDDCFLILLCKRHLVHVHAQSFRYVLVVRDL